MDSEIQPAATAPSSVAKQPDIHSSYSYKSPSGANSNEALVLEFKRLITAMMDAMQQDRLPSNPNDGTFIFSITPLRAFTTSENVSLDSFKLSGGVRIIVLAIQKHHRSKDVVYNGCQALVTIMHMDSSTTKDLHAAGGIASCIAAISSQANNPDENTHVAAIKVLRNLTQEEDNRLQVYNDSGIEAIVDVMKHNGGFARSISHAALLLSNLAFGNAEIKEKVGTLGGLATIAKGMHDHIDYPAMQARGCLALRNLCYNSRKNHEIAGQCGVADALVTAIRKYMEDREIAHQSCVALANMSNESDENRTKIIAAGGGPVLVQLMQKFPQSLTVADDAISVIRNISVGSTQSQTEVGECGGVEWICKAMKKFKNEGRIVEKGCAAIRYLCFLEGNRERVRICGGLEDVVHGLQANMDSVSVVEHALLAIGNSTFGSVQNKEIVGGCGGIKTIMQAIEQHRLRDSVQSHGCRVIRNLTDGVDENRRLAVEHGAITGGVFSMMGYGGNASVQEQACAMLLNIALCNDYLEKLEQAEVRRLAEKAIATHPKNRGVHLQAGMLLDRLNGFDVGSGTVGESPNDRTKGRGLSRLFKKK